MANYGSQQHRKGPYDQYHQHTEVHTQQYSGFVNEFMKKLKGWFYSSSSDQNTQMAGHNCISAYQQLYEASTDDPLEIIRNMQTCLAQQISEVMKQDKTRGVDISQLEHENHEQKKEIERLQEQVQQLSDQLKSARSKMVITAGKRGILPTKERAALESAVKDYFNQTVSAFADGYPEHAMMVMTRATYLFCHCYETASKLLSEKMVTFYEDHHDCDSYKHLKKMRLLKNLGKAIVALHGSEQYLAHRTDDAAEFWSFYQAIMEAKSTMLDMEKHSVISSLEVKLSQELEKLKENHKAWASAQGNFPTHESQSTAITSMKTSKKVSREKVHNDPNQDDSCNPGVSLHQSTSQGGTMSILNQDTGLQGVEIFIKHTVNIIISMILTPSPIVPSIRLKQFDERYVRIGASRSSLNQSTQDLNGTEINVWYAPILLAPSAGNNNARIFEKGVVVCTV
jgi:hypothetical protein